MSDPRQNIDEIMQTAANSMRLPIPVAQMFMRVAAELYRLRDESDELRQILLGHERRIADMGKNISRLQGTHGA